MISRYVVARCSLWCKTGAISRSFSFTYTPFRQDRGYYRQARYDRSPRKLHRRVVDENGMEQQLDIMRLSIADLESADRFGSLSIDSEVDEDIKYLVESEKQVPAPAPKRRKPASLETSSKADEHSLMHSSFSNREMVSDTRQVGNSKGPSQSHQPVSKHANEHRISVPVDVSNQMNEHSALYNKFSHKKSLSHVRPGHKDWSKKFGSLSRDVDKFLDKYLVNSKRYST